jgi:hypothetical protein
MTDLRQAAQQALEALKGLFGLPNQWESGGVAVWRLGGSSASRQAITALRTALEQQAEPAAMRMPKVGDKVVCLEDESLGEVVSLTAGGSPDITFDDGTRGTYLLREFAELFGYVTPPAAQWDKPSNSFNDWWNGDYDDSANPFEKDSAAYWAWAGWQAAQRQWVGLTDEEFLDACQIAERGNYLVAFQRIQTKLKERNT